MGSQCLNMSANKVTLKTLLVLQKKCSSKFEVDVEPDFESFVKLGPFYVSGCSAFCQQPFDRKTTIFVNGRDL